MKYDFNMDYTHNFFADSLIYANNNVNGLLVYGMVLTIFIVLSYVFIKKTDDVNLSLTRSLFISVIISIIFYYMGRTYAVTLFSGTILIFMIIILVSSIGTLYFYRNRLNG